MTRRPAARQASVPSRRRTAIDPIDALRLPLRAAIAAGVAVGITQTFALGSPLYALVSAVIVTDLDAAQTRKLALPRMIGTGLGAGIGGTISLLLPSGVVAATLGVLLPMFLCQLLRQPAAAKVAGYVSGIVIVSFSDHPWAHARDRLVETLVGIAAAALVSAVPVFYRPKKKEGAAP